MLKDYFTYKDGGDQAFTVEAPKIKFGAGSLSEAGGDAVSLGLKRVVVFSDPRVAVMDCTSRLISSLNDAGVEAILYDACEVEPTDASFVAAGEFMKTGNFDGVFSIGGGSVMDTAKTANLLSTYPDDLMAYVNAPIGQAKAVPGPLKPHVACPTTFGTASECTGIAICDFPSLGAKSGISHPRLRPVLGIIDPLNLSSLPKNVLAANGFDVFSHAVESVTARPYTHRPAPETPDKRPLSQGANPYSDLSCLEAIRLIGHNLVEAVNNPSDEGYEAMAMAGMLAGIGFGNAGCHLPHGMSYAVAGLSHDYVAEGWPGNHPMVPHGISVIVNAPAVFRFTGKACPERHLKAAEAMGANIDGVALEDAGNVLAERVIEMMQQTGMPNGVSAVGYSDNDIDALTERAFMQKRLSDNAPLPVSKEDMRALFVDAMKYW
ncbi:hydroxyacid-oxoacid transhydrogenase [Curvivirga sp.]|uniref:hydroxyacid-oxoacid transhydrogenase n=1 Tax=Curvivirga sp. TaxID=2856848 RepID=UPI003B593D2F